LLSDLSIMGQETTTDTVVKSVSETAENFYSAVRTRSAIESVPRYTKFPTLECVPKKLEMDYSVILNKPFFIKNVNWVNTANVGTVLTTLNIPLDILSNPLVRIPFTASLYYRAKISVVLQVAGTPMHAGLLIASALPNGADSMFQAGGAINGNLNMNKYMAAPHVFMSANEATPVILEVPFYVNSKLAAITINGSSIVPENGNYAEVVVSVVNPLTPPTSGSTSLSISAHFMFTELEFYAPHVDPDWVPQGFVAESFVEGAKGFVTNIFDRVTSGVKTTVSDAYDLISSTKAQMFDFIDSGRAYLRAFTGLHNPSDATISSKMAVQLRQNTNVVDAPIQIEKLDPYSQFSHFTRDYTFDTDIDEMLLSEICSKPMYVDTFGVRISNGEGDVLFSRPITPFQEIRGAVYNELGVDRATIQTTSLLQNIHFLSRYWRGGLKLHIQSVMSNFHFCKLTIARNYSPDVNMITSVPSYLSVPNLMMETLEFTGHQVHTIDLPYISPLEQLPCTTDMKLNALQHGMYYIYVHQPLVVNGSVPTNVKFNVYISGAEDLQFFGYATRPLMVNHFVSSTPTFNSSFIKDGELIKVDNTIPYEDKQVKDWEKTVAVMRSYKEPVMVAENSLESLFIAEADVEEQQDILLHKHEQVNVKPTDLRPIVSVRDYTRRWSRAYYKKFGPDELAVFNGAIQVDVASLLGVRGPQTPGGVPGAGLLLGRHAPSILNYMFLGYSGGARFKISLLGSTISEIYYVPPGFHNYATDIINGREWRGTAPFPELLVAPAGSPYQLANSAQYAYGEFLPNVAEVPTLLAQSPMQDKPNYLVSSGGVDVGFTTGDPNNRTPMTACTHEVEVPHMSPFRFVGNASKGYQPAVNNYSYQNANNNMGYLIIKLASPVLYLPGPTPVALALEIFVSTDDVGRSGYQVFAPTTVLPAIPVANGAAFNYYQRGPDSILNPGGAGVYPGIFSTPASTANTIVPAYDWLKALYKTVP